MNRLRTVSATVVLSAVALLFGAAQAMEIQKFDKMAARDQGDYISLLITGAENSLIAEARSDLANKVQTLFSQPLPGDKTAAGIVEFERNLDRGRIVDVQNIIKNPNARRLEVEDAMAVTLKKNGIELPRSFFTIANDFRPKLPLQPGN